MKNVLVHQIENGLYQRQILTDEVTNFECRLVVPKSELRVQIMKDSYAFDFILFGEDIQKRIK